MALRASACAVKVALACLGVARLQIGDRDTATPAWTCHSFGLAHTNERDDATRLLRVEVERRHLVVRPPLVNDLRNFVAGAVTSHKTRFGEIGPRLATLRVTAMTERAVLLEEGLTGRGEPGKRGVVRCAGCGLLRSRG